MHAALVVAPTAALLVVPAAATGPSIRPSVPDPEVVRDCGDSIPSAFVRIGDETRPFRFRVRPAHDVVAGPVAFGGLKDLRPRAAWEDMVARDQWIKSIALVRRRSAATLEVPAEQRSWMRLEYGHSEGGGNVVRLRGCRRRAAPFSGGFTIDYAAAPQQGRCAELLVWPKGADEPIRRRLFAEPIDCP